mmetsp:Transcript_78480/g.163045  ORF Transcript_78480/g.163045 Transcript_78480/m.163045 type:complete len:210 (+) Transcript_78480:2138-2767(+)
MVQRLHLRSGERADWNQSSNSQLQHHRARGLDPRVERRPPCELDQVRQRGPEVPRPYQFRPPRRDVRVHYHSRHGLGGRDSLWIHGGSLGRSCRRPLLRGCRRVGDCGPRLLCRSHDARLHGHCHVRVLAHGHRQCELGEPQEARGEEAGGESGKPAVELADAPTVAQHHIASRPVIRPPSPMSQSLRCQVKTSSIGLTPTDRPSHEVR